MLCDLTLSFIMLCAMLFSKKINKKKKKIFKALCRLFATAFHCVTFSLLKSTYDILLL